MAGDIPDGELGPFSEEEAEMNGFLRGHRVLAVKKGIKMKTQLATFKVGLGMASLLLVLPALHAGSYSVDWYKISSGGGMSTGGSYSISGTLGQPEAGAPMRGGLDSVAGGFWSLTSLVAAPDFVSRRDSTRVTQVSLATLLTNDTDLEDDPLSITAVGSAQPAGATVAISGGFVVYVAPSNAAGDGSFTYTLSDGTSTDTGVVTITQTTSSTTDGWPDSFSLVHSGGGYVLRFLGAPGRTYGVQYTTNVSAPYVWREFVPPVSLFAPASGVLTHTDVDPPDRIRLYRAVLLR